MKKYFLIFIFLLCGCSNNLDINGDITEIKYNDIKINENDFSKVKNLINKGYKNNEKTNLPNKLTVKTNSDIYYFTLNNDKIEYDGKSSDNDKLNKYLINLTKKYTNNKFYNIFYMKNYETNGDGKSISLDKTSNYIIINFNQKVINFKINEIESNNDKFTDIDLLYSNNSIKDKVIIRKSVNYDIPDIRISFENKYGYVFSIIPTYQNGKVEFVTDIKEN